MEAAAVTRQPLTEDFLDLLCPCPGEIVDPELERAYYPRTPWDVELWKAVRLCPRLDVCCALLRGERVPVSMLDPQAAKAYGLL